MYFDKKTTYVALNVIDLRCRYNSRLWEVHIIEIVDCN
jgi:hypothetical protein